MLWESVLKLLSFTGVKDITVWQGVFINALLIPVGVLIINRISNWWNSVKPAQLLFKNCLDKGKNVFVFHSQMSGADNDYNFNPDQKYITRFPEPLPSNNANLGVQKKLRIDPVMSRAEAECLTDVYSVLGMTGKVENINTGDLINDWNVWSAPIFSIGFNPKTLKLIEKCNPLYFELVDNQILKIKGTNISYNSMMPNDVGVIQKTFIDGTNVPVFILAGIGTLGTSVTGYILRQNFTEIGKLFGDNPFCIFIKVKINEGRTAASIDKIYPRPNWQRIILYPLTYIRFKKKFLFEEMIKNMICPKCNSSLNEKIFVHTGFFNHSEKTDVTGKTEAEIRSHTASGAVFKPKGKSVNECLARTTGIGYLEKKLVCKCGYSRESDNWV